MNRCAKDTDIFRNLLNKDPLLSDLPRATLKLNLMNSAPVAASRNLWRRATNTTRSIRRKFFNFVVDGHLAVIEGITDA